MGYRPIRTALCATLAVAAAACDERREDKAIIAVDGPAIAFGGQAGACLRLATVRDAGWKDSEEDDRMWQVEPAEVAGKEGCLRFPIVYGELPPGAEQAMTARGFAPDTEYAFEAVSDEARYKRKFQPLASNGVFYVEDREGNMVDIRKAKQ